MSSFLLKHQYTDVGTLLTDTVTGSILIERELQAHLIHCLVTLYTSYTVYISGVYSSKHSHLEQLTADTI